MQNKNSEVIRRSAWNLELVWQDKRVKTLVQIVFLLMCGLFSAYWKKNTLDLGISGSSAILWLGPMILGRAIVKKDTAGTVIGASVALWGLPLGIQKSFMYNLALYGGTGLALDVAVKFLRCNVRNPFGAVFAGIFAHMVKFGFIVGAALIMPVTRRFMVTGVAKSAGLHIIFGASAGIAAWAIYRLSNYLKQKGSKKA